MRRAAAACLLLCTLSVQAQPQPDAPPAPPPDAAPAPPPETPAQTTPPAAAEDTAPAPEPSPPAEAPRRTAPALPKPAAKPSAPLQAPPEDARDAQISALRAEVNRLQSELDAEHAAERAAALQPAEEAAAAPQSAGGMWGWLALAVASLAGGFALGWRMLDRRIRRRYGGLRIY